MSTAPPDPEASAEGMIATYGDYAQDVCREQIEKMRRLSPEWMPVWEAILSAVEEIQGGKI